MRLAQNFKLLGVVFLAMLLGGVYLTYGIFTKKFTDYDEVTLRTSTIGLQLPARADVKIRGVIVGEVLGLRHGVQRRGAHAGHLPQRARLDPGQRDRLDRPQDPVRREVRLAGGPREPLARPDRDRRRDRAHRHRDRGRGRCSSDLYPLLRTVQPAEINQTLNALATALEGRGELIGENLETVDSYLKRINPQIPDIVEDLRLTAQVSDTYAAVMPEIAQILDNTIKTTGTLEDREAKVNALFTDVAAFSDTARGFLEVNGDNLIRLGDVSAAQLRVFAKYAPELNCLTRGIVDVGKLQAEAFRNFTLHIVLETLPAQPRGYTAQDAAARRGRQSGPNCLRLPNPPWSQANPLRHQPDMNDGVDEPTGKGTSRVAPSYDRTPARRPRTGAASPEASRSRPC